MDDAAWGSNEGWLSRTVSRWMQSIFHLSCGALARRSTLGWEFHQMETSKQCDTNCAFCDRHFPVVFPNEICQYSCWKPKGR